MDILLNYLNSLPPADQSDYAQRSGTSVGYLRKARSTKQGLGYAICASLERESGGAIHCEDINENIDWRRIPDPAWPWHPQGKPVVDPAPEVVESAPEGQGA